MKILTKSIEDYIESIYIIEQEKGEIKSVDIASKLGVSKPAVNKAMNELNNLNLIEKSNYSNIVLTDKGRTLAQKIYDKHILIYNFLLSIGVSKENAEIDCCKIEHVISDETAECMKKYLNKK
ncbi:MAG: metal-dependent transcriptional regulator [Clostridia bacterium]|nr:metal-dependent transcriptional regulator [Clostridia bacterium]